MSSHNILREIFEAPLLKDPGSAGTISILEQSPVCCNLVSAGAEARTLSRALRAGAFIAIVGKTVAGTITLTVTGGYNEDGDTTFSITEAGQFILLQSFDIGGSITWRKISDHGLGNIAPADAAVLDELSGLTATATEINASSDFPASQAVTATADGLTTGLIAATTKICIITSASADNIATLPGIAANSLGIGHTIRGRVTATGCEIRTPATLGETINGVDADGTQEMALAANVGFTAVVEAATGWFVTVGAATVPD